ncbi:succinate dehydrogenase assembly factor 2 [Acetobacteraceae bacterium H6797]|nr:succinate dehydrogenase assembly factor 2 [Acetobacteraceae bacterium H6797]
MSDTESLSPRRRRLIFRAEHRGTKETDLLVGGFVTRNIQSFSEAELDEIESVLDFLDVDLADWLSGRRPVPPEADSPMLRRLIAESNETGAGMTPAMRSGLGHR